MNMKDLGQPCQSWSICPSPSPQNALGTPFQSMTVRKTNFHGVIFVSFQQTRTYINGLLLRNRTFRAFSLCYPQISMVKIILISKGIIQIFITHTICMLSPVIHAKSQETIHFPKFQWIWPWIAPLFHVVSIDHPREPSRRRCHPMSSVFFDVFDVRLRNRELTSR